MGVPRFLVPLFLLFFAPAVAAEPPGAGPAGGQPVDLALVLAVDVSGSIDQERFQIQRNGYAAAFSNPAVIEAIAGGEHGAIAVTMLQWSGPGHQRQTVGWTILGDAASAAAFAAAIQRGERAWSDWTSISGAIDAASALIDDCGCAPTRRVIDVSGDGASNSGRPVEEARAEAVGRGITINGLPITTVEPQLDAYYRDHVVGGDGAFLVVVESFDSFAGSLRDKLMREIAGDTPRRRYAMLALP